MPKFLNQDELYRLLQRELPKDLYADGAPSGFFTTADMDSVASVAATGYANLEEIYDNYWPQTSEARISDWEITAFAKNLDVSLTLQERRDAVVAKMRLKRRMRKQDMKDIVQEIIGTDKLVEIANWGGAEGGWVLDESELDISTIFFGGPVLATAGPQACELTAADLGLTDEEYAEAQQDAYTYSVLIYGYTLSAAEYTEIDLALMAGEPGRSAHAIYSGLDPSDMIVPIDENILTEDGDFLITEGGDELLT